MIAQFSVISETLVISNCRASDCDRHQTSDFIKSSGKCSDSEPNGHCLELGIYTETGDLICLGIPVMVSHFI